jgi:hypothetical protein
MARFREPKQGSGGSQARSIWKSTMRAKANWSNVGL